MKPGGKTMNSLRFDRALLRLLLVTMPFSCGGKTVLEPSPSPTCGSIRFVSLTSSGLASDGGASGDGGAADGGLVSGDIDGGTTLAPYSDAWCARVCGSTYACFAALSDSGQPVVACKESCHYGVGCGRRPSGLTGFSACSDDALQGYLEQAAYLEAASVVAFRQLADELASHSAPAELVAAARIAAREEEGHAAAMRALAGRKGQTLTATEQDALATGWSGASSLRPIIEIAHENAVEGCVRELIGALIASYQAEHAEDPEIRAALQTIAREEIAHARLSFAVADWAENELDAAAQAEVAAARQRAIAELSAELSHDPAPVMQTLAGWPRAELMQAWIREAQTCLWT